MSTMTYNGYTAKVEYSEEDGCFVGHVLGLRDISRFDGTSVDELKSHVRMAIDRHLRASGQLSHASELLAEHRKLDLPRDYAWLDSAPVGKEML